MISLNKIKPIISKTLIIGAVSLMPFHYVSAAATLDEQIAEQEQRLFELKKDKQSQKENEMSQRIFDLEKSFADMSAKKNNYDAEAAVNSLYLQINDLRDQLTKIFEKLNSIEESKKSYSAPQPEQQQYDENVEQTAPAYRQLYKTNRPVQHYGDYDNAGYRAVGTTNKFMVNPGPSAPEELNYTQDAINSQGNSTMVFRYSPTQLYKIYCRVGYLTDLAFKKGETISFVGGGDTAGWAVNSVIVDGTPHLYIKPVVESSTTNLIVTTDHHSYQLILNSSDWYNPMVRWSYDIEDQEINILHQQKEDKIVTGKLSTGSPDLLYFNYESKGDSGLKPEMVFDDGKQTFIKFRNVNDSARLPILFVKERGNKTLSLVNYTIKDNYFIVDKIFSEAELRLSDSEIVRIRRK